MLWPLFGIASASEAAAAFLGRMAGAFAMADRAGAELTAPEWATPNSVALELPTMQLRNFSTQPSGPATLVCAPFALHGATIADFAPGHSVVEALRSAGLARVFVTDWRSATPDMQHLSIDSYLADLHVAVDELSAPVDLIGLCQGGWLALVYAARFPEKVRRLVLVGAPVDVNAAPSQVSRLTADVPLEFFANMVRLGDGRVVGNRMLELWGPMLRADEADRILQISDDIGEEDRRQLETRFRRWYTWTVDLPGTYYLQVIQWLFKENRIAAGRFVALGRQVDLADIRIPTFLLAGRDDELIATEQLFAAARLIGTAKPHVEMVTEPCSHLSLFLGRRTLTGTWQRIAHWLTSDISLAQAS